jgi:transcription termination factor Rho
MTMNIAELETKSRDELLDMAKGYGISGYTSLKKQDLVLRLLQANAELQGNMFGGGVLEVMDDGYGFLRQDSLRPGANDVYVSQSQIRRFGLRTGDMITGQVRLPKNGEKYNSLLRIEAVNGIDPEQAKSRPHFGSLTPVFPDSLIKLETTSSNLSTRLLDMIAPIGRGQRGLIVSPPKAGKTMLMKHIANGAATNHPDLHLMVCLIGERPEEVTDMKRSVNGEVVSSTFDEPVENHTKVAELALERAKRLVECGTDVMILLDGITRLTRAYNLALPPSGRTLSGGVDSVALYPPKRFFGTARNIEEGGSLTIIATCLIDTGSRMDDLIYEEFKGTGNMELHLCRRLAERRIWPSMNIQRSGTRHEELLMDEASLQKIWLLRRMANLVASNAQNSSEATELILERLGKTKTNEEFLATLTSQM